MFSPRNTAEQSRHNAFARQLLLGPQSPRKFRSCVASACETVTINCSLAAFRISLSRLHLPCIQTAATARHASFVRRKCTAGRGKHRDTRPWRALFIATRCVALCMSSAPLLSEDRCLSLDLLNSWHRLYRRGGFHVRNPPRSNSANFTF